MLATLVLLELLVRVAVLDPAVFPYPSTVLARLGEESTGAAAWLATGQTLAQATIGLSIGTVAAVLSGLLLGSLPQLERAVAPVIEFLRPIPSIAILPLVILSLGVGHTSAIVLVSVSSYWLVLVLTIQGARSVDPATVDALQVFGLGPRQRFVRLTLPSSAPFIVTGVRIAGAVSIIVAITAELVGGMPGLGRLVARAEFSGDRVGLFAYIVVSGLLGLAVNAALQHAESRLLGWHPSQRRET
ncbi:ABC transporter permease [Pseudonocardia nematodicida]|uniref:ABC transporter permease n=1 Tax=Pseudonocardia nematodicida TaxID=1206997 RepID=A0ABV1KDZ8_9PSEU